MVKVRPVTDKPTCELKTEAEVLIVRSALKEQIGRLNKAVSNLEERRMPQVYMMSNLREHVVKLFNEIPEGAKTFVLKNKHQVDRAADAVQHTIVRLRREQMADWCPLRSAEILICGPLLDRIRIGWKKPAPIPLEVLEQIKAREDGRFYNMNPGDWIVDDWYSWKEPKYDETKPYEWTGV